MDTSKPWIGLSLPVDRCVRSLFEASVDFSIGDGGLTQFWTDPWHNRESFCTKFPDLFKQCTLKTISVKAAVMGDKWMRHFKANLSAASIDQFSSLWNVVQHTHLIPDQPDSLTWRWTANGTSSAASASAAMLSAQIKPLFAKLAWSSDAPLKCQFFVWLVAQGKCLTADNLAKRGWPHNPPASCACKLLKVPPTSFQFAPTPRRFGT